MDFLSSETLPTERNSPKAELNHLKHYHQQVTLTTPALLSFSRLHHPPGDQESAPATAVLGEGQYTVGSGPHPLPGSLLMVQNERAE